MRLAIRHRTSWLYEASADYAAQLLRVTPRGHDGLEVLSWQLRVHGPGNVVSFEDGFGNLSHIHTIVEPHDTLVVEVEGLVETSDTGGFLRGTFEPLPPQAWLRQSPLTMPSAAIRDLAARAAPGATTTRQALFELMRLVSDSIAYRPGVTNVRTTAAEALAGGAGVCQDHAHVFVAAARCLGVPARYVGGYLCVDDDGVVVDTMRAEEREEASHAWAEAWDLESGCWLGFDPANRTQPGTRHLRSSVGLDYASASPLRGVRRGRGGEAMQVGVQVQRIAGQ